MKTQIRRIVWSWMLALIILLFPLTSMGAAQEYPALEGVTSVKAIFDIRNGDPLYLLEHLQLVQKTFADEALRKNGDSPDFALVFMDKSVLALSQDREGYAAEDKEILQKMDKLLSTMVEEGAVLEVCQEAVDYYEVELESIDQDIKRVPNGWISSIGYQAKGYSLVPMY